MFTCIVMKKTTKNEGKVCGGMELLQLLWIVRNGQKEKKGEPSYFYLDK